MNHGITKTDLEGYGRGQLIGWLAWVDANGCYTDSACEAERIDPLTRVEALGLALSIHDEGTEGIDYWRGYAARVIETAPTGATYIDDAHDAHLEGLAEGHDDCGTLPHDGSTNS